ncbi:hypothetical protein UP10_02070 [Bradyrhizobium sp. LTSPM299]|nr:hypothetical protein UP10_02070 [Bradyrhizobium sp. LTSPM299]
MAKKSGKKIIREDIELDVRLDNDGPNSTKWTVMNGSKGVQSGTVSGPGHREKARTAGYKKQMEIEDQYRKTGKIKRADKFEAGSFLGVPRKK